MIAKRLRDGKDGKGNVLHLVHYITAEQGKSHRVGEVFIKNCISEAPMMAAREMLAKQDLANVFTDATVQTLTAVLRDKYHVVFAIPTNMR